MLLIFLIFSNSDGECHVSNITVVTDTTETDNVTSISIDHDSSLYGPQEHDNKVERELPSDVLDIHLSV